MSRTNGSNAIDGRIATLDKTIDSLTKRFGEGTIMRLGEAQHLNVQTIPTGSISLDIASVSYTHLDVYKRQGRTRAA